jgi:hypothetical protein
VAAGPPRPLDGRGLEDLEAPARLIGSVRQFDPGDRAAAAGWDRLAVEAVRAVESARGPEELARRLQEVVRPGAPTVRVFASGAVPPLPEGPAAPPTGEGVGVVWWEHLGDGGTRPVAGSR